MQLIMPLITGIMGIWFGRRFFTADRQSAAELSFTCEIIKDGALIRVNLMEHVKWLTEEMKLFSERHQECEHQHGLLKEEHRILKEEFSEFKRFAVVSAPVRIVPAITAD